MQHLALADMPRVGELYQARLGGAFARFNSLRLFTCLPTILAIVANGSSGQQSLLTWVGANATMAAWLFERNERRLDKTVLPNIRHAAMCLITGLVIVGRRLC